MAVPKENLLSLGYLISRGQDTLTKQRELDGKNSEVIYLQQRLKVLKERERIARQQNRQLLQQFDEAQDTLKEMLASIAAMKMIRIEYEKYLQENGPYWQQQLKEKTRSAHEKRMKDHLRPNLKHNEVTKSRDRPFSLQDFQNTEAPQEQSNYSRERWPSHSQPQPARLPIRSPYQSFNSSQVPPSLMSPSIFPHFHPSLHHNDPWVPSHHRPWSVQDTQTSLQAEHLLSQITGVAGIASAAQCLLGHLATGEPPPERTVSSTLRKDESSSASSSKRERGGGSRSNPLSQELDIKPVRLSSGPAESSQSGRDSSMARSKKTRGRKTQRSSDRRSSQVGSTTSSSLVIAPVTAGQSSDSDAPSHKGHSSNSSTRMMSGGLDPGHENLEEVELQGTRAVEEDSESPSEEAQQVEVDAAGVGEKTANKEAGNEYPEGKSQSCGEESGSQEEEEEEEEEEEVEEESASDSLKIENGTADEVEKQEKSSSEKSSSEEEEENINNNQSAGKVDGGQEDSQEETEDVKLEGEDDEEEAGAEDEKDAPGDDDRVNREIVSISSRNEEADEDVDAGSEEEEQEPEEESEEEEEHRSDAGESEEDRDSEDSIISPQEKRQKQTHVIPEEAVEDDDDDDDDEEEEEDESNKESSDGDSNAFSDIETLLAPQAQRNEETNIQKSEEESAEICDKVQVFHVKQYMKSDHQSDSDEFDHFYD